MDHFDKTYLKYTNTFHKVNPLDITEELAHHAVSQFGENIIHVPKQFRTKNLWEYAIMKHPPVIIHLDEDYQSLEIYTYAIKLIKYDNYDIFWDNKLLSDMIKSVPDKYMTIELIKFIIDNYLISRTSILHSISKNVMTYELYMYAFNKNVQCIGDIPKEYVTNDMWLQTIPKLSYWSEEIIKNIPIECLTNDTCENIINVCPCAIKYIPEQFITFNLCELAMSKSYLNDIPDKYRTEEFILKYPNAIKWLHKKYMTKNIVDAYLNCDDVFLDNIPDQYKTLDICKKAARTQNRFCRKFNDERYDVIEHIPIKYLTTELCKTCITAKYNIQNIPDDLLTDEFWEWYVDQCFCISDVPEKYLTYDICIKKVKMYSDNIKYVPDHLKTQELCNIAIFDGFYVDYCNCISYIPDKFITKEICEESLWKEEEPLLTLPEKFITMELCYDAICNNGEDIMNVPYKYITKDLCEQYVKNEWNNIIDIPYKYLTKELYNLGIKSCNDYFDARIKDTNENDRFIRMKEKDINEIINYAPPYIKN